MIRWLYGRKLQVANTSAGEFIIDKEMGYSRFEFLNQFKLFAGELNYSISGNSIKLLADSTAATSTSPNITQLIITFSEQSDRIIGSLIIPRLFVNFHFINYTQEQYKQFFKKFDLSFQRGGG